MKRYFTLTVLFSAAVLLIPAVPVCCVHGDTEKAVTETALSMEKQEATEKKGSGEAAEKESAAAEMNELYQERGLIGKALTIPLFDLLDMVFKEAREQVF